MDESQELQMIQFYSEQMAQALMDFDMSQGINHPLSFYVEAIKYTTMSEWNKTYPSGQDEYYNLFYSTTTCY